MPSETLQTQLAARLHDEYGWEWRTCWTLAGNYLNCDERQGMALWLPEAREV